ncbi:hypothetical protein GCM10011513_24090 [Franconibacter daqui]|nr:hypothetical protein GCM10011513_24090 [Franconibacter daqui]
MRTDNTEHKALFTIPTAAHITAPANIKPLPEQRKITGHKQTDAYLWVLEVIRLNEPAHLDAVEEALSSFANPSFVRSLTVNGYLPIDQQAAAGPTPIYSVDSGGVGSLKVTFIGGDLSRDTTKTNNTAPVVSGANAKVVVINAGGEDWVAASGGEFIRLG